MAKLRIAIIGTGGIAHAHMDAYVKMKDVEIVAGSDIVPDKAKAFFKEYKLKDAKAYDDTRLMLAETKPDAVSICTYNTQHSVCAIQALDAGAHVLLEKPMTVYLDEALEIRKKEKETGKIVSIGFQPRFDSRMKKIKEIVESGALGKIYYIQTGGGRRRGIPGGTFIEKDLAGVGALADIGCYSLDMVLNTIGYPKPLTVSATAFDHFGKNPAYNSKEDAKRFSVDDFCSAFIRLEGGITLDFRMSWAMHMNTTGATIILGTDGGLKIEPANPEGLWGGAWDGSCGNVTFFHDKFGIPTETPIPMVDKGEDRFFLKVRSFVEAVQEGKPAPVPTSQIIFNQAIIDGIIRSNEKGGEVKVVLPKDY